MRDLEERISTLRSDRAPVLEALVQTVWARERAYER
jgi:hypothetical protein